MKTHWKKIVLKDSQCLLTDKMFTEFAAIEWWASGSDWLIFSTGQWDMNSAEVDRLQVHDPCKENCGCPSEGLALVDHQLSLNPFYGAHGYNTVHSDHRTWRAVQIPSGHWGHILTEARLCHQSHSTSRIFKGSKSINSWLHNCSMGTEKKNTLKNIWAQELNFTCTSKEKRKYKIC